MERKEFARRSVLRYMYVPYCRQLKKVLKRLLSVVFCPQIEEMGLVESNQLRNLEPELTLL